MLLGGMMAVLALSCLLRAEAARAAALAAGSAATGASVSGGGAIGSGDVVAQALRNAVERSSKAEARAVIRIFLFSAVLVA